MRGATFDERVAAYGAAHLIDDATAVVVEALEKARAAGLDVARLEFALNYMEDARRGCLALAASGAAS